MVNTVNIASVLTATANGALVTGPDGQAEATLTVVEPVSVPTLHLLELALLTLLLGGLGVARRCGQG